MTHWGMGYAAGFLACAVITRITAGQWPWMIQNPRYGRER